MLRRFLVNVIAAGLLMLVCRVALGVDPVAPTTVPVEPESSIWDLLPARNVIALVGAAAIIGIMVYWMRAPQTTKGFTIHVDEEDITFSGMFPASMEPMVIEFLRNDVQVPGSYKISGHWEERMLIVAVRGEEARGVEQRIRNFLKLNLRPPVK